MRILVLITAAAFATDAFAQNPPAGAPPPQQQRGGGGRGRAVRVMTLTSPAFRDGAMLPAKFAQSGAETSPPLAWTGAPDSTRSFVLIVHDLDAAVGQAGTDDMLHWMVWNIPGTATSLSESIAPGTMADSARQISASGPYYRGPGAPESGPPHHYVFELYALDAMIDVPAVGASPAATRAAVIAAMAGHVRGKGVLVALFKRGK